MKPILCDADYKAAALSLGCSVAAIKAVFLVEAPRGGFNPDDSPVTLFEGHKFHAYTDGLFDKSHPTLSFPKWTRQHYGKGWEEEKVRLNKAVSLDREAALMSTSWGRAQIMGFNYGMVGFVTLQAFINAMFTSEAEHLKAFCSFVKARKLTQHLRDLNWDAFALGYNGSGYKLNQYEIKMANAYNLFDAA